MIILIVCIIFVILFGILFFNQVIREENSIKNAYATIDVLLKKRYDLIPNLVEVVKGSATHELEVFSKITQIRTEALKNLKNDEVAIKTDTEFTSEMKNLFAVAEQYPNLKSNTSYLELQKNLLAIENELSAARRTYNAAVTEFNITLESFPTNLIGKMMHKNKKALFTVNENIRETIKISY